METHWEGRGFRFFVGEGMEMEGGSPFEVEGGGKEDWFAICRRGVWKGREIHNGKGDKLFI